MAAWYVRSTGGSNSNNGTTFALGVATLEYARGILTNGDTLYVCSDESNPFNSETNRFSIAHGEYLIGCDLVDGSPYNGAGRAYIVATSAIATTYMMAFSVEAGFTDIDFDGSNELLTLNLDTVSAFGRTRFVNCNIHGFTDGIKMLVGVSGLVFVGCNFYSNTAEGMYIQNTGEVNMTFINCSFYSNTADAIKVVADDALDANYVVFDQCRLFDNDGYALTTSNCAVSVQNCVFYSNGNGIYCTGDKVNRTININHNVFMDQAGYALLGPTGQPLVMGYVDYNCFYGNTSGNVDSNFNNGTLPGVYNVLDDPVFASVESEEEDFRYGSLSPCIDAGIGFTGGK